MFLAKAGNGRHVKPTANATLRKIKSRYTGLNISYLGSKHFSFLVFPTLGLKEQARSDHLNTAVRPNKFAKS